MCILYSNFQTNSAASVTAAPRVPTPVNVVSSPRAPTPVSRVSTPEVPEVRRDSVSSESTQSSVDYATRVQDPRGEHRSSYAIGPDKGNFLAENVNIFSSIKTVRFGSQKNRLTV